MNLNTTAHERQPREHTTVATALLLSRPLLLAMMLFTWSTLAQAGSIAERSAASYLADPAAESVEWMTADADLVVRIRAESIVRIDRYPGPMRVTARVLKTFKGPSVDRVVFTMFLPAIEPGFSERERHRWNWEGPWEGIVFLDRRGPEPAPDGLAGAEYRLRRQGGLLGDRGTQEIYVPEHHWMPYTMRIDLTSIDDEAELVAAIEKAVAMTATNKSKPLPHLWRSRGRMRLVLPINSELEAQARMWAGRMSLDLRLEGIAALAHFDTALNRQRLRDLFDDPFTIQLSGNRRWGESFYPVRQRAWEVLSAWNAVTPDEQPIIQSPADLYRPAWRGLVGAGLLLLSTVTFLWRRTHSLLRTSAGLCSLLLIALVALWIRSSQTADQWVWGSRDRYELLVSNGMLQFAHLKDSPVNVAPLHLAISGSDRGNDWNAHDISLTNPSTHNPVWGIRWGSGWEPQFGKGPSRGAYTLWFALPLGWIATLLALPVLLCMGAVILSRLRRARLTRAGCCLQCGYDLRATAEDGGQLSSRCPECGSSSLSAAAPPVG